MDHNPPHIHALYGESEGVIRIGTLELVAGSLPRRALALTREWASLHEDELLANWVRLRTSKSPLPIAPLE